MQEFYMRAKAFLNGSINGSLTITAILVEDVAALIEIIHGFCGVGHLLN